MWEVGLPPSPVEFSSLRHSQKLSCSWLLGTCPRSCPLWPGLACLFTVSGGIPLPPFSTQGAPPSLLRVFIVLIAYYSVSLFCLGQGRSVQGAMLFWPRDVCGSTTYCLAHLVVHVFPSHLGAGDWQWPRGPPGFSVQHEVEMLCTGVEGSKFCLFSVALPGRCVSSVSPKFHFRRHTFCFRSLAAILENPLSDL
jgi:hypothetical protein